jgi:hypothetical protein
VAELDSTLSPTVETSGSGSPTLSLFKDDLPQLQEMQVRDFENAHEWWLFDLETTDGAGLVLTFGRKNPLISRSSVSISVEFCHPQLGSKYVDSALFPRESCQCVQTGPDARLSFGPDSYIVICGGPNGEILSYQLRLQLEGISVELTARVEHQGVIPGRDACYLRHKQDKGLFCAVNFAAPRMSMEGRVVFDGRTFPIKGIGYHDHPWGTDSLLKAVSRWQWARLYNCRQTILCSELYPSSDYDGGLKLSYRAEAGCYQPEPSPSLKLKSEDWRADGPLGLLAFPHRIVVQSAQHREVAVLRHVCSLLSTPFYNRSRVRFETRDSHAEQSCWAEYTRIPGGWGGPLRWFLSAFLALVRWKNWVERRLKKAFRATDQ